MSNIVQFRKDENFYKGKIILMSKHKNDLYVNEESVKKFIEESISQALNDKQKSKKNFMKNIFEFFSKICALLLAFYTVYSYFDGRFSDINERIDLCLTNDDISWIKEDIDEISTEIDGIDTKILKINKFLYGKNGVDRQLEDINEVLKIIPTSSEYNPNDAFDTASIEKNDVSEVSTPYKPDTSIGLDADGNILIAQNYINETIFLTYTENNQEIYFLGQYNENYRWNGYCVTNVYNSDGTLHSICESNFDDGQRLDYKSFYQDSGYWIYSNRTCGNDNNENTVKESIKYEFIYDKSKNFTKTNVRTSDIIYVDDFINTINPIMFSYYHGDTSDGKYNDNTGKAYLIDYFEDGTVRMLYYGNFKNGYPNDDTGNAWYIVKEENTDYMYYNGHFGEKGNTLNNPGYKFENNLSIDRINEILKEKNCTLDLKWKQLNG